MKLGLDLQDIIFKLQTYWAGQGCLIWQPYYSQVGAGTMNPATFLRVLGPEPWKVAYLEPSVRPDDGRYGINPNRLQQFFQYQVILKPDTGNPQELYLNSLLALGIDPAQHDIRFVEDNWESPALSAWGLGWEVWLDGQEITQFTYFQQSGGVPLEVPSVEITYGLERIAMTLQNINHFKDIRWNGERTYGDVYQVAEREHSSYYFEKADVPRLREMFRLFVEEAENALEGGLVLPAYDNIVKSSHTFNIMDSRGAVGFTERQALFGKMRELSRRVAEAYIAQRDDMGYPWLKTEQAELELEPVALPVVDTKYADFLLEIGTEELPVADLDDALEQLQQSFTKRLTGARLSYSQLEVLGTPRRLSVLIKDLQTAQEDRKVELKGPPADRAFDAEGKATKVAEGFARGKGVDVSALEVKDFDNGRYVVVSMEEKGKSAMEILAEQLPEICAGIHFVKSMRWNQSKVAFSRPARWLVALLGEHVVPFSFAGLKSDRLTRGMRFSAEAVCRLKSPTDYLPYLEREGIVLDPSQRRDMIWQQARTLAQKTGGQLEEDPALLDELTNLVERPTALLGSFDKRYLQNLPPEVLIAVMKKHQRYFPVLDADGNLSRHFIIIRNGDDKNASIVVDGNLQVILARFADAEFFIKADREKALEDFVPDLAQLTFQKELGSMLQKTTRIEKLSQQLAETLALDTAQQKTTARIARLCKADLATDMVVEMTALQGVMGRYYARLSDEPEAVAEGIFEHYLPRSADDMLPTQVPATVVGIADRLDSIVGLFAVGLAPTANKDPFALRRAALGLNQILIGLELDFDLQNALRLAAENYDLDISDEVLQNALEFIQGRLHGVLLDKGYRYDVVEAVEQVQSSNPAKANRCAELLNNWVQKPEWETLLPAYSRCARITRNISETYVLNPEVLQDPAEHALNEALSQLAPGRFEEALQAVEQLVPSINTFFDKVLVMAEDEKVRQNRLGLLQNVVALLSPYADISKLEGF
jgi:glycyl-tRNA synthetase